MKIQPAVGLVVLQIALAASPVLWPGGVAAAQNPLAGLENAAKEKATEAALTKVLNDNLPLTLDAKNVYPTVATLPGGPFSPTPLKLTAEQLNEPLPPGDYTINTLGFCSEYSVHRPGAGVAYVLGPYEGKAAGAVGALIWRGTEQYHIAPQSLQAVSWAIQSGLTYAQMPKTYQGIVDQVIPDFKSEITGDFVASLENTYNTAAKGLSLPPLDTMLAKLGKPGQLALDAERQRKILTSQNTSDQIKEQTLFQGQESGAYTPVKAENGPWTERVPGRVYMKLLIAGGNMASNNVMQIRVMSPTGNAGLQADGPQLVRAAYGGQTGTPADSSAPSITSLMEGMLGYSQGQGAQALGQVAVAAPVQGPPPPPTVLAGKAMSINGNVSVIRAGTTTAVPLKPGDEIDVGDTIETGSDGKTYILFADNTQMKLSNDTKLKVDEYVYDPNNPSGSSVGYRILEGAFQYIGGLLVKPNSGERIETSYGCICIRGTELIGKVNTTANTVEVNLISGALSWIPTGSTAAGPTINAPMKIEVTPQGVQAMPLTQDQCNTLKAQYFPDVPTS